MPAKAIKLDHKGNEKSNSKTPSRFIKLKKVINKPSEAGKALVKANKRKGNPKGHKAIKHVLWLTNNIYITTDRACYHVCVVNDKAGKKDIHTVYATNLQDALKLAIKYGIKIPMDVQELSDKLDHLYEVIMDRIPLGVRPKDLFEEYKGDLADAEE